jgi:hypothetical protein
MSANLRVPSARAKEELREFQFFFAFCFFLLPISINGNSANYGFLLLPLVAALRPSRIQFPSPRLLKFIFFYIFILLLAAIYQYELLAELPRRLISFLLFMSMFSLMFVKIDDAMVRAFKKAIVAMAVLLSTASVLSYFALGGSELGFEAKDVVGGQRYGFVYILAFWLVFISRPRTSIGSLAKHTAAFILLSGIFLSFSRASVIALIVSSGAYALWTIRQTARSSLGRLSREVVALVLSVALAVTLLGAFFPVTIEFFDERLFGFLTDGERLGGNLEDSETSEGTRLLIWRSILEYVWRNPITGSGFLGVWILEIFDEMSGSAHNQYFDVLFRVGILGFFFYSLLLYRVGRFLAKKHPSLFWGFLGVVVYGMFHETFKESHGGFVLAFLLGMMAQTKPVSLSGRRTEDRRIDGVTPLEL